MKTQLRSKKKKKTDFAGRAVNVRAQTALAHSVGVGLVRQHDEENDKQNEQCVPAFT